MIRYIAAAAAVLIIAGAVMQVWWPIALAGGLVAAVALSGLWEPGGRATFAARAFGGEKASADAGARSPRAEPSTPNGAPPPRSVEAAAPEADAPADPEPVPETRRSPVTSLTAEPSDVVRALYRASLPHERAVAAHLWLQDPATATFRLVAAEGERCPEPGPIPMDDPSVLSVVKRGCSSVTPLFSIREGAQATTLWRYAFPVVGSQLMGIACVDIQSVHEPAVDALEHVACDLQPNLATAIQLTIARAETSSAAHLLDAVHDLSRRLRPEEVSQTALRCAIALSDAISGSVLLMDPSDGVMTIVASEGLPDDVVQRTTVTSGEGIAGWVYASGKPLLVEDLPSRGASRRHGVRSAVSVPIADDDGCLGVLSVGSRDYPARFTDAHVKALGLLARQTAVALRNARAVDSSTDLYFGTLTALVAALETKDPYARGGTGRVTDLVVALADAFDPGDTDKHALHVAALLHDIGMGLAGGGVIGAGVRPLSTVERAMLKAHPVVAAEILADVPALREVVPIVYHHHEWYDGHGYVGGVAGEAIPFGSRVLAVADAFVAMTSDRPYRHAMTVAAAVKEIEDKAGSQFDPAVVEKLKDVLAADPDLARRSSGE